MPCGPPDCSVGGLSVGSSTKGLWASHRHLQPHLTLYCLPLLVLYPNTSFLPILQMLPMAKILATAPQSL